MSWKNDPTIRDLESYAKKHGHCMVILFGVHADGDNFSVVTYGLNQSICKAASTAGSQLVEMVDCGHWPDWPDEQPYLTGLEQREAEIARLRKSLKFIADGTEEVFTGAQAHEVRPLDRDQLREIARCAYENRP